MDPRLVTILNRAAAPPGRIMVLTGAGISADSGLPTFRGQGGFWTVGSRVYRPEEMGTKSFFDEHPETSWAWYLWRRNMARRAEPNEAHRTLAELQEAMGERMVLVTQNVDGLHRRAGHEPAGLYEIHGSPDEMRCSAPCRANRYPIPKEVVGPANPEEQLTQADWDRLRCPRCDVSTRPHVLWFDETYTEELYRIETIRALARRLSLLITVGTSGMTSLPEWIAHAATGHGAAMIDINPEPNPLRRLAERVAHGYTIVGSAVEDLPPLVHQLRERISLPSRAPARRSVVRA